MTQDLSYLTTSELRRLDSIEQRQAEPWPGYRDELNRRAARITTLTACDGCGKGYRARDMYEVEARDIVHGDTALLCESCHELLLCETGGHEPPAKAGGLRLGD